MAIISDGARRELVLAISERYRAGSRVEKRRILDEFVALTGYHRKHAFRILGAPPSSRLATRRPRSRLYDDAPNSRLATLSVWETEADARAIYEDEGGLYQAAIAKLKPILAGPPDAWMGPLTRVDE